MNATNLKFEIIFVTSSFVESLIVRCSGEELGTIDNQTSRNCKVRSWRVAKMHVSNT